MNFYVDMRQAFLKGGQASAINVTVRRLEALIRVAEASAKAHLRTEVLVEDAEAAIRIMQESLEQVGIDVETGEIDLDILYTGRPGSLNVRLFKVMATIEEMEKIDELVRDDDLFETLYTDYSIPRTETARAHDGNNFTRAMEGVAIAPKAQMIFYIKAPPNLSAVTINQPIIIIFVTAQATIITQILVEQA
jgi:DNA replicative helicase MCM subunit Mcm2 (Cdc46/Mcm family)